jgi:hypothetical protein
VVAVHLLAARRLVGPAPPGLDRLPRRLGRDQAVTASTYQVLPPRLLQRLAHLEIVLRLEELQQRPFQLAVAQLPGDEHCFVCGSMPVEHMQVAMSNGLPLCI